MTRRYLICPGFVRSRTDGQQHFIHARQIAFLYGVRWDECVVLPSGWDDPAEERHRECLLARARRGELIALHPRYDGNYTLPQPRPANPYGCHNRAPTAAPDCQYTLSALGQVDPRCAGCRWKREASPAAMAECTQTPASS